MLAAERWINLCASILAMVAAYHVWGGWGAFLIACLLVRFTPGSGSHADA